MNFSEFGLAASSPVNADRSARLGASLSGTNLARAGYYNQRVVLQAIRRNPDITRTEIAAITGLTAPTIANITGRLFDAALIVDAGRRQGERGQPAVKLRINPDGCFALGVNIDRDHVTVVAVDLAGGVRGRFTRQIAFAMPADVLSLVRAGVEDLRARDAIRFDRVLGMGVAVPDELGHVPLPNRPKAYEAWNGVDLAALLAGTGPWPVHVDNDAAAAAIGEAQFGREHDQTSFFYLLVSAGLGGGLVIDGAYFRGATARSGEIGFLPLHDAGPRDGRTLQDVVSLSALGARMEAAGVSLGNRDPTQGLPTEADAVVERWLDEASTALLPALTAVNCLINPAAVLISGRLPDAVLDALAARTHGKLSRLAAAIPSIAPIRRASLSRDAPAVGAAILPFLDRILPSDSILMK